MSFLEELLLRTRNPLLLTEFMRSDKDAQDARARTHRAKDPSYSSLASSPKQSTDSSDQQSVMNLS
jgi:hypothetical protein